MDLLRDIVVLVLVLAGIELVFGAIKKGLLGTVLHGLRIRFSRPLAPGYHRFDAGVRTRVGHPDTTMAFVVPVPDSTGTRVRRHTVVTTATTQFAVRDETTTLDELLEAFDDEMGPLEIEVFEPGTASLVRIDPARS